MILLILNAAARAHVIRHDQGCSGTGTRRNAVPANIFEPERRCGEYCLSQAER